MPTSDSRLYYYRLTKGGFTTLTVPQAFLDARPLVKVEGDEENDPIYYTESDGLTYEQAMRLYKPKTVALMAESEGKPENLGPLSKHETLPEAMTHAFFALTSPKMTPDEIAATVRTADAIGVPISQVLIPWGEDKDRYLQTGVI